MKKWVELTREETDTVLALVEEWVGLAGREENLRPGYEKRLAIFRGVLEKYAGVACLVQQKNRVSKIPSSVGL